MVNPSNQDNHGSIGIFDSGYGGLTVFKSIAALLPQYDYIYLGDNGRAPYGNRSFETIHEYTWQCVQWLLDQGCPMVIVACNTSSAKALRTIQQRNLPGGYADRRVLGVIRPTAEVIGNLTKTKTIGIMGTNGTVSSNSYPIEIHKLSPEIEVLQQACPMFVPLIESGDYNSEGAYYFVELYTQQLLQQSKDIDTIILACTHYPLLEDKIKAAIPDHISLLSQGPLVANSLKDYLHRHPEMETRISKGGNKQFYTTDSTEDFDHHAAVFFGEPVQSTHLHLA